MTTNRKREYFCETIDVNGEDIPINIGSNKGGVYYEIIQRGIEQLDIAIQIHKRVLVYYFILHTKIYTPDNYRVTNFMKNLKQKLGRDYQMKNIGYEWVREHERDKADTHHYHVALFLDGSKIQHPKKLLILIRKMWKPHGHVSYIRNPFDYINRNDNDTRLKAIWRISYMAKIRGKGHRDPQANDSGTSRLKFLKWEKVDMDKKGNKTGGRSKGTKNKRTQEVIDILNELDCNPIEGIANIAKIAMGRQDYALAGNMYKELSQYIFPKRRAIEVSAEVNQSIGIEDLTDQQRKNLKALL